MKEVLRYKVYIKMHNEDNWTDVTYFNHFVYQEKPSDTIINLPTVESAEEIYSKLSCCSIIIENKLFSKNKRIALVDGFKYVIAADDKRLLKCGGLDVLFTYEPASYLTVKELSGYLTPKEFTEYLTNVTT